MINPIEIPRPNQLEDIYKNQNKENTYTTEDNLIPPYPTINYTVEETQNSSCRLIRSSLCKIPQDQATLNNSSLQFSLYLQPFAEPSDFEKEIPKVESKYFKIKKQMNQYSGVRDAIPTSTPNTKCVLIK